LRIKTAATAPVFCAVRLFRLPRIGDALIGDALIGDERTETIEQLFDRVYERPGRLRSG
jgi:hypothetical protein